MILTVENEETDRGTFAKVAGLASVRSKKNAGAKQAEKPEFTEEKIAEMDEAFQGKEAS